MTGTRRWRHPATNHGVVEFLAKRNRRPAPPSDAQPTDRSRRGHRDNGRGSGHNADISVVGQSMVGTSPTSSLVAVVANSTADGGTNPSTAVKVKRCLPGLSGSGSTSTTMISPALNCL